MAVAVVESITKIRTRAAAFDVEVSLALCGPASEVEQRLGPLTYWSTMLAQRGRAAYQVICEAWTKDPSIFKIDPHHLIPGPHT